MKTILRILTLSILLIILSGCTTTQHGARHLNDIGRYTTLQQGSTTKKDVYIAFGQPHDVQYKDNDSSVWRYFQVNTSSSAASFIPFIGLVAGGVDSQTMVSNFTFDRGGYYQSVRTTDVKRSTNMWAGMSQISEAAKVDKKPERVGAEMKMLNLPFDEQLSKLMAGVEIFAD